MNATLLLIPGLLNSPRVFDRLRAAWAASGAPLPDWRVVDVREPASIEAMADAAWALLADVPAERPLVLAGFSMGGYVAQQMLATPRRAVQGLGLLSTSARPDAPEGASVRERAITAIERDFGRYVASLTNFLLAPASVQDAALLAEVRADMMAVGGEAAVRQHRAAAARADRRDTLHSLKLPTLVLCGTADPVTPAALSEELAAQIAGAQLELIEGAGHLVPFEHPQRLAAALQKLMSRAVGAA